MACLDERRVLASEQAEADTLVPAAQVSAEWQLRLESAEASWAEARAVLVDGMAAQLAVAREEGEHVLGVLGRKEREVSTQHLNGYIFV